GSSFPFARPGTAAFRCQETSASVGGAARKAAAGAYRYAKKGAFARPAGRRIGGVLSGAAPNTYISRARSGRAAYLAGGYTSQGVDSEIAGRSGAYSAPA